MTTPDELEKLCDAAEQGIPDCTCGREYPRPHTDDCPEKVALEAAHAARVTIWNLGFQDTLDGIARARRHAKLERDNATLWNRLSEVTAWAEAVIGEPDKAVAGYSKGIAVLKRAYAALKATEGETG